MTSQVDTEQKRQAQEEERQKCQELLARYLDSSGLQHKKLEEQLFRDYVRPRVKSIIRRVLGVDVDRPRRQQAPREEAAEDIYWNILLELHRQLERWRNAEASPPASFLGYAAMATYHGCKRAFGSAGQKSAPDASLQVFTLLTQKPGFALWQNAEGVKVAGYQSWKEADLEETPDDTIEALERDPEAFANAGFEKRSLALTVEKANPVELMMALLDQAGAPLEFSACVRAFAALVKPTEPAVREISAIVSGEPGEEERDIFQDRFADDTDIEKEVAEDDSLNNLLRKLWKEILTLPLHQRKALLLNFPDWDIRQLPERGIAGFADIASALAKTPQELATLWNTLPLNDAVIALDVSRDEPMEQDGERTSKTYGVAHVKNWRQSAYRTLSWRMRPFDRGALNRLWQAAIRLVPQRPAVFLLYIRDPQGASLLAQLPAAGYANREAIAEAIQVPLAALNELWGDLPLSFRRISDVIHKPTQAVALLYIEACDALQTPLKAIQGEA